MHNTIINKRIHTIRRKTKILHKTHNNTNNTILRTTKHKILTNNNNIKNKLKNTKLHTKQRFLYKINIPQTL